MNCYSLWMDFAGGQGWYSRAFKRTLGRRAYDIAKATKVALPLRRTTYSQSGEDLLVAKLFTGCAGKYLDIGAGNPIHLSNTYALYRQGWSGILIDPLSANRTLSRVFRPRDTFIQALASNSDDPLTFFEMDPSFYSTTDEGEARSLVAAGAAVVHRKILLPSIG